jgi:peptidoglycan/LPS O-acetylase OafA/YrhL
MPMTFGPGTYRFLLATLVLIHHTSSLGFGAGAVYVFFCLSGYWMHTVWITKYAKAEGGYHTFILARMIRLLPLFWLANLIGYATDIYTGKFSVGAWWVQMHLLPKLLHFAFSNLFLMGYYWLDHMAIVPAWSLVIELQFYLVLPLMVALMGWIGLLVLPLSAAIGLGLHGTVAFGTVLGYTFFFYLGMLASHFKWAPSASMAHKSAVLALLIAATLIALPQTRSVLIGGHGQNEVYRHWNELGNSLLAITLLPLTIWSASLKAGAFDRMLGDMSYAVYLIHAPLVSLYSLWFGRLPAVERLPIWVVTVLIVFGVSWLAWRFVDKPAMLWRERYLLSRSARRPASDVPAHSND